ncbi:MAG: DUF6048 family protein [Prolixibacteraceae bacterium]
MKRTLKSIFSSVLLLVAMQTMAQKTEWRGINVGADLSRFVVPFIDSTRYGWEISADYELLKDMLVVAEIGSQTTKFQSEKYKYNASGAYTRLGVDYNYMKHLDPESTDKLLIGLRYAFTTYFHEADEINISDSYWGDFGNGSVPRKWLGANWLEIATGMRAQIINNFYLSWSVRFKINIWQQADDQMQPFHVPGYGRAWNNSSVGFNYTLSYKIPIIKKKSVPEQ